MKSGWQIYLEALSQYFTSVGYISEQAKDNTGKVIELYICKKENTVFTVVPLSYIYLLKLNRNSENGLVFFLVNSELAIPLKTNFQKCHKFYPHLIDILGISTYGNVDKAIYMGEVYFDQDQEPNSELKPQNVINISIAHVALLNSIEKCCTEYRKKRNYFILNPELSLAQYYNLFVKGYIKDYKKDEVDFAEKDTKANEVPKIFEISNISCSGEFNGLLQCAEKFYRHLNGMSSDNHRTTNDLFRPPIPFFYDDLRQKISSLTERNVGKVKLLLIDNKQTKFNGLKELLKQVGNDVFELSMLDINTEHEEKKTFDAAKFFSSDDGYKNQIYNAIHQNHFILLDFYLDDGGTYLAHDLIDKISDMKREKGQINRIWYFVTSAVFDSVMKYSESGYLARSCDLSVVHAGDDPVSEKRHIIFIYKLLTFINARLKRFKVDLDCVQRSLYLNRANSSCPSDCKKTPANCLKKLYQTIERLLVEYDNIADIHFPDKIVEQKNKVILERLKDILDDFKWLPEADWQIIDHEIDYLDDLLKDSNLGGSFSCAYILNEIKRRASIY